ncbi:MAG: hypothetical protein V4692_00350 [Bdellovibrionota bacterium]
MSGFDDESLSQFLKKNAPQAPAAPREEFQNILRETEKSSGRFFSASIFSGWKSFIAGTGAFFAAFTAAVLLTTTPQAIETPDETGVALQAADVDEILEFSEQIEAAEIGEDYLSLLAENVL